MNKKAYADHNDFSGSTMEFVYDTSKFKEAILTADGKLHLVMHVSSAPMFDQKFADGLASDIGRRQMEQILDQADFEINRQIAVQLLTK